MDARSLSYKDGFFGVISGKDCLHHLIKYPQAMTELARVLRPGGRGCFYEPLALNPLVCLLRGLNIYLRGYVGEHMLTRDDILELTNTFGKASLSHHVVLSTLTRFIASMHRPLCGIRRKICTALIDVDTFALEWFPWLTKFPACAYIQLLKSTSN